jgi:hypothetical protein
MGGDSGLRVYLYSISISIIIRLTITYRDGKAIRFALAEYDMLLRRFIVVFVVFIL